MAPTPRRSSLRKALTVGAVAIAAALAGVSAPAASAAPVVTPAASFSTLDTAEGWAAVQANAEAGYPVSDKLAASCGAKQ